MTVNAEYKDEQGTILWVENPYNFKRKFAVGQLYADPSGKRCKILQSTFIGEFDNGVIYYVVEMLGVRPDKGHPHLIGGEFQSDKYPTCPRGKVPLSVKDPTAQDLLWEYAQRRRPVDTEFATDLETALKAKGYVPIADKVGARLEGNPKTGEELLPMLERRMGSMKMVGERDDLLLDCAIFIARTMKGLPTV